MNNSMVCFVYVGIAVHGVVVGGEVVASSLLCDPFIQSISSIYDSVYGTSDCKVIALCYAASQNNEEAVKVHLSLGVSPNQTYFVYIPVHSAAEVNAVSILELFSLYGADFAIKGPDQETALHVAARHGSDDAISYLVQKGLDLCARTDSLGLLPIHEAAQQGHRDTIELLVRLGANRYEQTSFGETADDLLCFYATSE